MKRIATPNRAIDKFAAGKDGFRAAVPGVSSATEFSDLWFNHMQEAICRTIEAAGMTLSDTDFDQFVNALNTVIGNAGEQFSTVRSLAVSAGLTVADLGKLIKITAAGTTQTFPPIAPCRAGTVLSFATEYAAGITTLKANAAELLANPLGATANTFLLNAGESIQFVSNGASWDPIGYEYSGKGVMSLSSGGSFTVPAGVTKVFLTGAGGGGGGAAWASAGNGGGGGGSGASCVDLAVSVISGAVITVVIGLGGSGGATIGAAGGNGSTTSFGALVSLGGGLGGGSSPGTGGSGGTFSGSGSGIATSGQPGEQGNRNTGVASGGNGGSSMVGAGGFGGGTSSTAVASGGFGAGGAGGGSGAGGNGSNGILTIKW